MPIGSWFRARKRTGEVVRGLNPDDASAVQTLLRRLDDVPGDLRARRQLGDAFKKAGRYEEAVAQYQALAGGYAAQGLLFKAIAACKLILELVPDHEETSHSLAALYARRSAGSESAELSPEMSLALADAEDVEALDPISVPDSEVVSLPPPLPDDEDIVDVTALAASLTLLPQGAVRLERPPAVPLFSGLSPTSFATLVHKLDAWEAEPDALIVGEGEEGETVFVVVRGRVRIERLLADGSSAVLAHLGPDSFFGEMALLSKRPRAASAIAEGKTELLEISRAVLEELARHDPSVTVALESFCKARLLENFARTSPLLTDLPKTVVDAALATFDARRARGGEVLVEEGKPGPGLFLLLQGEVDVSARTGLGSVRMKRLAPGDLFGEMSLLGGGAATASVVAVSDVSLLLLPREAFATFAHAHPPLEQRLTDVAASRRAFNERFLPSIDTLEDATSSALLV